MRRKFLLASAAIVVLTAVGGWFYPPVLWTLLLTGPPLVLGWADAFQKRQTIRRNFPIVGNLRYMFEAVRPEINQYFVESNVNGRPFSREQRSLVYQRAKGETDTIPFGTQLDVRKIGYEWLHHSIAATHLGDTDPHVEIGTAACRQPYKASLLNISAMSFGSLGERAIEALSVAAKMGDFFHNTGEGSISSYHTKGGGDLCWQIGTAYFGCRNAEGGFDAKRFVKKATLPQVKLIEIKLSQGAKPGHGGILPGTKVTAELAKIRGVLPGQTVMSPPAHTEFTTPAGLLRFVSRLRDLSDGKPVGFKLCIGEPSEFLAICKAMVETGIVPDFISVDGGEGGTAAAPLEFSDMVGMPLREGLSLVDNALRGVGLRDQVRVIAAGRITNGFDIVRMLALGADLCNSARGMMLALGCIQALRCNTNGCPTGIATQNKSLQSGLVVSDKAPRVARYQRDTVVAAMALIGAAGLKHPRDLRRKHIHRRISETATASYAEIFPSVLTGSLLRGEGPDSLQAAFDAARSDSFITVDAVPVA